MITFLRWIFFAATFCYIACGTTIDTARAHDFGGSTTPEGEPEPPPPCKLNPPCLCYSGGGGNGSNGPPNAGYDGQPISLWTGEENHNQTDLVINSVYPIRIARSYQELLSSLVYPN